MKDLLKDPRIPILAGVIFWTLAGIDSIIQGTKYSFDIRTLEYLSPFGKICFWIGALCGAVWFIRLGYGLIVKKR
jgi:hypothetical protein